MFWQLITESNLQKTYCLNSSKAEQLLVCTSPFASRLGEHVHVEPSPKGSYPLYCNL